MIAAAFTGFRSLPAPKDPAWWEVLGVSPNVCLAEIELQYKTLARQHHPDAGGSHETMLKLNAAIEAARKAKL